MNNKQAIAAGLEKALGRQQVTFTGVPATSHFASVLVAADYRMKRLAMNFEPSPVRGMPSFLQHVQGDRRRHGQHHAAVVAGAEVRVGAPLARRAGLGIQRRRA